MAVSEALGTVPTNRSVIRPTAAQDRVMWTPSSRIPILGVGGGSDPARDTGTGLLKFSGGADNWVCGEWQFPHRWWEGLAVVSYLLLRFPTEAAGDSRWRLDVSLADPGADFSRSYGNYTGGLKGTVANPVNALKLVRAPLAGSWQSLLGAYHISCAVNWKLQRFASSDVLDTDNSDIVLVGLHTVFGVDALGSVPETTKS